MQALEARLQEMRRELLQEAADKGVMLERHGVIVERREAVAESHEAAADADEGLTVERREVVTEGHAEEGADRNGEQWQADFT